MTRTETDPWTRTGYERSFDWPNWRLSPERLAAGATVLAYATALASLHAAHSAILAALIDTETILLWMPWRLPRKRRSPLSFWLESLVGQLGPVSAIVVFACASQAQWFTTGAAWPWYGAGLAGGCALLAVSGTNLRGVLTGEIAFSYGPTPRAFSVARTFCSVVGTPGEEALFRAPLLALHAGTSFTLVSATAFVARHHVQPGRNGRGTTRSTLIEILAALLFSTLTIGSGSIYPALAAHVLNNIPGLLVEVQREKTA